MNICTCRRPPLNFADFTTRELGMDANFGEVSVEECIHCGTHWLRYFLEDEAFTGSGRWWRVVIPQAQAAALAKEVALSVIEAQSEGMLGGSYFGNAGRNVSGPMKVR